MSWLISASNLKALCKEHNLFQHRQDLNEVLYLHHKGITRLENLDAFTGLKALYLESNAIAIVEGLAHMKELRCLYMAKNLLNGLQGISQLCSLQVLDVSHNLVSSLAPLSNLVRLTSLYASHNKISSVDDLKSLEHCTALEQLDLGYNQLSGDETLNFICTLPLLLLKLSGNPKLDKERHIRRRLIVSMPTLKNLDNVPCLPRDKRLAEAYLLGGVNAERKERNKMKEEDRIMWEENRQWFAGFVSNARQPQDHDKVQNSINEQSRPRRSTSSTDKEFSAISSKIIAQVSHSETSTDQQDVTLSQQQLSEGANTEKQVPLIEDSTTLSTSSCTMYAGGDCMEKCSSQDCIALEKEIDAVCPMRNQLSPQKTTPTVYHRSALWNTPELAALWQLAQTVGEQQIDQVSHVEKHCMPNINSS